MNSELQAVQLPAELCRAAEEQFGQQFGNVAELLAHVLRELLRDDAAPLDRAEQRILEERLRDLGYI